MILDLACNLSLELELKFNDILDFIRELSKDTWKLLAYPQVPNLIVKKINENHLNEDEIIPVVKFFLDHKLYRCIGILATDNFAAQSQWNFDSILIGFDRSASW